MARPPGAVGFSHAAEFPTQPRTNGMHLRARESTRYPAGGCQSTTSARSAITLHRLTSRCGRDKWWRQDTCGAPAVPVGSGLGKYRHFLDRAVVRPGRALLVFFDGISAGISFPGGSFIKQIRRAV